MWTFDNGDRPMTLELLPVEYCNLLDPSVEPSDKAMEALLEDVACRARARSERANQRLMEELRKLVDKTKG
jgi:hypothetical protein